jgi:hypothetical protein
VNCDHGGDDDFFSGLDEDPNEVFSSAPLSAEDRAAGIRLATEAAQYKMHREDCKACRGTGRFVGYTGRVLGDCFKCKGKGYRMFRQSLAQREKQADQRANRKAREQREIAEQGAAWAMTNADDHAWMIAKADRFDFARSMVEALTKYGHLTEKQHATVTRLRLADAERDAARKAEKAAREANAPVVDVSLIETAFAKAQENGIKRPKMILNGLKFSLAPATGRNAGALYVVRKDDDQYLGKIMDGRFTRVRECTVEQEAEIVKIASNPHAEAVAYGQRTGNCCICNRELTNHASIDAGIGPICASKYGW